MELILILGSIIFTLIIIIIILYSHYKAEIRFRKYYRSEWKKVLNENYELLRKALNK